MRDAQLSNALLAWYDANGRDLPWRPGKRQTKPARPDPYAIWLSEIMLQQTTVATVMRYYARFMEKWPTVESLAKADDGDVMAEWAGLGYYARARNLLKCARIVVEQHSGLFPDNERDLLALPGIGPYTAAAIATIAFGIPATVVDGNVERVLARLRLIETALPAAKPIIRKLAGELTPCDRPGDYAQAIMDLGATICRPKNPDCMNCPWNSSCLAFAACCQEELPVRRSQRPKPERRGIVYVARREDGAFLLERRPDHGLLGGMLGWPGSKWSEFPENKPPCEAEWISLPGEVIHEFTHFRLILAVRAARLASDVFVNCGDFIPETVFDPSALPTLMRKAYSEAVMALDFEQSESREG